MAKVITIPATRGKYTAAPTITAAKRKTAGYARVSTDMEEQLTSYDAQVEYYTNYIKARDDWEFVAVYADEGISGCNTKKRDGFNTMIDDALAGKIDLIITKSVSRFARNTVDSLTTIRKLKENGVEVYFEKENIRTFDSKGELLLTIMSSLAQEESRSISENTTWGKRKCAADGKVSVPFGRFLGYDRGENGELVVNEEQAKIVRRIYGLFLKGRSTSSIARQLTEEGVPTPGGKSVWSSGVVKSILTNEKYKGDALLQKVFTTDFLTKKKKVNEGEVPQYYIVGDHEAIIEPEVFDSVQFIMEKWTRDARPSSVTRFSGRIKCGECGAWYGSKVWHSTDKYRRVVWQCNDKFKGHHRCDTPHLYEETLENLFVKAINIFCAKKDDIIAEFEKTKDTAFSTDEPEAEREALNEELVKLSQLMEHRVYENARTVRNQGEFESEYKVLEVRARTVKARLQEVTSQISEKKSQRMLMKKFMEDIKELPQSFEQFDEDAWYALVDYVTVYGRNNIQFTFNNGTVVRVRVGNPTGLSL